MSDNIQPFFTPFPILHQSAFPCNALTVAFWPTYRFLRRKVRWSGVPISLKVFQFKGNVGNLISGSSAFSKPNLYIWKLSIQVLLKPSLKDYEHNPTSMGSEHNCPVVWTFFSTAFLWNWNENWPFPVLWPLLGFPNLLTYWVQDFNTIMQN